MSTITLLYLLSSCDCALFRPSSSLHLVLRAPTTTIVLQRRCECYVFLVFENTSARMIAMVVDSVTRGELITHAIPLSRQRLNITTHPRPLLFSSGYGSAGGYSGYQQQQQYQPSAQSSSSSGYGQYGNYTAPTAAAGATAGYTPEQQAAYAQYYNYYGGKPMGMIRKVLSSTSPLFACLLIHAFRLTFSVSVWRCCFGSCHFWAWCYACYHGAGCNIHHCYCPCCWY
jgi:hypothetical protein